MAEADDELPPRCRRCRLHHEPVSVVSWQWALRDIKPKPPLGQLAALMMLSTRLDPKTGCGWVDARTVAADTGAASSDVVERAVRWAKAHFLLSRAAKGGRAGGSGRVPLTLWHLSPPPAQTRSAAGMKEISSPLWDDGEAGLSNPLHSGDESGVR
jgi:hypothetical protein